MSSRLPAIALLLLLAAACSSEADAGEPCDVQGGGDGVCATGTVCGRPTEKSSAPVCIYACRDDKDCPNGAECKGVDRTNVKGCRFKD